MRELNSNSWLHLPQQNESLTLSGSGLADAVDCGWVEQMLPFVHTLSRPGECVLDPFCGWGTTLVAAASCGRRGLGVEIEGERVHIARQRLQALGLQGLTRVLQADSQALPLADNSMDLCLTSVPYFGPWQEQDWQQQSTAPGQCYRQTDYAAYLAILDRVFAEMARVLKPGGWLVVMAENLRLGDQLVPLAWDCGRLLQAYVQLGDERILTYNRPSSHEFSLRSNRAHEYALPGRKAGA